MTEACFHCKEFSRSRLFHRAAAEAGKRAAEHRARHAHAGRNGPRPQDLPHAGSRASRSSSTARAASGPEAFEEGIAEAAAAAPERPRPRVGLPRGRRRPAVASSRPSPTAELPQAARRGSRSRRPPGTPHASNPALRWHPVRGRASPRSTRRASSASFRASATRSRTSRTSRRGTTGRSARYTHGRRDGLAGPLPRPQRRPEQPVQGLSLDYVLQPALAPAAAPVAAMSLPEPYRLQTQRRGAGARARRRRRHGARLTTARRARSARRRRAGATRPPLHRQIQPRDGRPCPHRPCPTPRPSDPFPRRLATLAAVPRATVSRSAASRSRRPGNFDTHANQKALRRRPEAHLRLACSPSSATSRPAGWPTGCSCTSGPSSAAGPGQRVTRHRPRRRRNRLRDRHATRRAGLLSEYPRLDQPRRQGQPEATVDFRGRLQRAARAVAQDRSRRRDSGRGRLRPAGAPPLTSARSTLAHAGVAVAVALPGALLVYLSFNSGGFFVDTTALAAVFLAVVLVVRVIAAEEPFAGVIRAARAGSRARSACTPRGPCSRARGRTLRGGP